MKLRPTQAVDIRQNDAQVAPSKAPAWDLDDRRPRFARLGRTPNGALDGGGAVHVPGGQGVDPDRFRDLRDDEDRDAVQRVDQPVPAFTAKMGAYRGETGIGERTGDRFQLEKRPKDRGRAPCATRRQDLDVPAAHRPVGRSDRAPPALGPATLAPIDIDDKAGHDLPAPAMASSKDMEEQVTRSARGGVPHTKHGSPWPRPWLGGRTPRPARSFRGRPVAGHNLG
jgi:hypothetical protein